MVVAIQRAVTAVAGRFRFASVPAFNMRGIGCAARNEIIPTAVITINTPAVMTESIGPTVNINLIHGGSLSTIGGM
jgi:hypothetical protein